MLQLLYDQHTLLFSFLLFGIYLIIHSDVMHEKFFSQINGATQGNYMTTYGTIIQGITFVITYMVLVVISSLI